jgi:hypothetical protein
MFFLPYLAADRDVLVLTISVILRSSTFSVLMPSRISTTKSSDRGRNPILKSKYPGACSFAESRNVGGNLKEEKIGQRPGRRFGFETVFGGFRNA